MNKACFIDRDGVLIEEKHYLSSTAEVELFPETVSALKLLKEHGFLAVVISNQAGVARGYFSEREIHEIEKHINELLAEKNIAMDGWYYCCHHPSGSVPDYATECKCRKPEPGMIFQAAHDLNIDLGQSCMIGDKFSDLDAAENAGCRMAVLVKTGHGLTQLAEHPERRPVIAENILEAAKMLVG